MLLLFLLVHHIFLGTTTITMATNNNINHSNNNNNNNNNITEAKWSKTIFIINETYMQKKMLAFIFCRPQLKSLIYLFLIIMLRSTQNKNLLHFYNNSKFTSSGLTRTVRLTGKLFDEYRLVGLFLDDMFSTQIRIC